ncbi:McrB family protein [Veillonella sp. 3627]|jgi:GTPase subunit of restriction endonuclease|uniref:McrB family protein n=1 Tax=Veillonella sp. 3627 TaxID=2490953 RepID=UPI00197F8A3D|nr:AAA family ATPase [Veillonella sp. 3627]
MNIYLRKILKHDITHQISVTKEVLNGFFGVYEEKEAAIMRGKKSGYLGTVTFLLSTDPRFGGDIKQIINAEGGIQVDDILLFVKEKDSYVVEVISTSDERHSTFISVMNIERHLVINIDDEIVDGGFISGDSVEYAAYEESRIPKGRNILLYGVPGSGKSWTIQHEYCTPKTHVERLVFHPDYTYSDFVGQILPNVAEDGQISYKFTPGPFTSILRDAYADPEGDYVLIIEEINRGNAPAIFGEVFQLLDRKVEIKEHDDEFPIGTSEYGITNPNIANVVYGNPNQKVRIPSNLSIIGTMNTSDQNVFTLDTAFQRRWEMRLIENNFDTVDLKLADAYILDTTVTWRNFCTTINDIVIGNSTRMTSSEDKRLGAYFVHVSDLIFDEKMGNLSDGIYDELRNKENTGSIVIAEYNRLREIRQAMQQNRKFPEKVIKYLWDDAFKFNRESVFEVTQYQSLEAVIKAFLWNTGNDRFTIFKETIRNAFTENT